MPKNSSWCSSSEWNTFEKTFVRGSWYELYIEKNKVDKHVKAETHVLDTLSIAPDITIVNESVSLKKQQNSPSLLHVVRLYMWKFNWSENAQQNKMSSNSGQNTGNEMATIIKDSILIQNPLLKLPQNLELNNKPHNPAYWKTY